MEKKSLILVTAMVAILVVTASAAALLLSGGDSKAPSNETSSEIEELRVGTTYSASTISILDDAFSQMCSQVSHQGLVIYNASGAFDPCLADSWYTTDSIVWIFNFTNDARWSDGVAVTPEDVAFTIEYLPKYSVADASTWSNIKSVEVGDNNQLTITLDNANSNFLTTVVAMNTLPKHIFENVTDPGTYTDKAATIGCGPYIYDYFDSSSGKVSFIANEEYRDGAPNVKRVTYVMYKNQDLMVMALKAGEIDATYIYAGGVNYYYVAGMVSYDNIDIMTVENRGVPMVLWFNLLRAPFNDEAFRKAVSYCIDYDELLNIIAVGYGSNSNTGFAPRGTYGFVETEELTMNLTKANELLDAAGYVDVDSDGWREMPNGTDLAPELKTRSDAPYPQVATLMREYLNTVGIDAQIKIVDASTLVTAFVETKDYDMAIARTTAWGMLDWAGYGSCYFDDRNIGWSAYSDSEFEDLVDEYMAASTVQEQLDLGAQIQEYYAKHLPAIALYWGVFIQPVSTEFTGYEINPMWGIMSYGTFFNLRKAA